MVAAISRWRKPVLPEKLKGLIKATAEEDYNQLVHLFKEKLVKTKTHSPQATA